jgi:selenoprotein W-related protein
MSLTPASLRFISWALAILSVSSCYAFQPVLFSPFKRLVEGYQPAPFPAPLSKRVVAVDWSHRLRKYLAVQTCASREIPEMSIVLTFMYCSGCRWGMRSFWMAQELLSTFEDEKGLAAITLSPNRPPAPGGQFSVQSYNVLNGEMKFLWCLKEDGRFPEIKELKRIVRDVVNPTKSLGHTDKHKGAQLLEEGGESKRISDTQGVGVEGVTTHGEPLRHLNEHFREVETRSSAHISAALPPSAAPNVSISYCTTSRWLIRAAWLAQEIVLAAAEDVASVTLIPVRPSSKVGDFVVSLEGQVVWDQAEKGRFPEVSELKHVLKARAPM